MKEEEYRLVVGLAVSFSYGLLRRYHGKEKLENQPFHTFPLSLCVVQPISISIRRPFSLLPTHTCYVILIHSGASCKDCITCFVPGNVGCVLHEILSLVFTITRLPGRSWMCFAKKKIGNKQTTKREVFFKIIQLPGTLSNLSFLVAVEQRICLYNSSIGCFCNSIWLSLQCIQPKGTFFRSFDTVTTVT